MNNKRLRKQIEDAAGSVYYTYAAHWAIVNRLKRRSTIIKIAQIALTALSAGGFVTILASNIIWLSWLGGAVSFLALSLDIYMLSFRVDEEIKRHTSAANELWGVREAYVSLLVDFDALADEEIRTKRDQLTDRVDQINKKYPGTDDRAFKKAQRDMPKYVFEEGEASKLLNLSEEERKGNEESL